MLLPHGPGVYRFRNDSGVSLYIGRAIDLRRRVSSYWTNLGDRPRLRRMVEQIASIDAVPCDSAHEAAWLERNLLERSKPRFNRARGGAETPGYLRLDMRAGSAGIAAVHTAETIDGTLTFGPHLGGTQLRLAASALNRLYPIRYTSHRLTGSVRDLAVLRGVAVADRDLYTETIAAVLGRDPSAVTHARNALTRARDQATAGLAFELSARLQAELHALDWIVAEQKVSIDRHERADLYGWSRGVLVGFELRAGRLDRWTREDTPEETGRRMAARTPPHWQPFTSRAAELASRLAQHQP